MVKLRVLRHIPDSLHLRTPGGTGTLFDSRFKKQFWLGNNTHALI